MQVQVDDLLPDVLLFPPSTDLHDHPLVLEGSLVLQVSFRQLGICHCSQLCTDKASGSAAGDGHVQEAQATCSLIPHSKCLSVAMSSCKGPS